MYSILLSILAFAILINHGKSISTQDYKQEQAKIVYSNPKYLKNFTVLTSRENRRSPYMTSANFTLLVPFGNNVTWRIEIASSKLTMFPFTIDLNCDSFHKMTWLAEWFKTYSNVPLTCPIPPDKYFIRQAAFPPKNFPMQMHSVDYIGKIILFITATKELVTETSIRIKYHSKGRLKNE